MIVVFYNEGQLGNRLFYFSHFIRLSLETNQGLSFLCFDEYYSHFEGTQKNRTSIFNFLFFKTKLLFVKRVYQFILYKMYLFCKKHQISNRFVSIYKPNHKGDMDTIDYSIKTIINDKNFKKSWIIFYEGSYTWYDNTDLNKERNKIIPFFKPIKSINENVQNFIKKNRGNSEVLVGIHIRRGDYADFANGIFYYNDETYINFMNQIQALLNKKVKFVISSNEKITNDIFSSFSFVFSLGHMVEDMYILSQCDYIIGAPSSFSAWSSFYGQKPLYQIYNKDVKINLIDFKIIKNREFVC